MRALVTAEYGHGDPQRQVLVLHAIDAADFARRLIDRTGECTDAELVIDWQIAATGRDLYFDSKLEPDAIRGRFGDRVERMIAGLSDRVPAAQYPQFVAEFAEELGVIRLVSIARVGCCEACAHCSRSGEFASG